MPRLINDKNILRLIDANVNRSREGLRVCEDICRFVWNKKNITREYKKLRHQLTQALIALKIVDIIKARNIEKDVGKKTIQRENNREKILDVFLANSQRVKESVRVLEEFSKLLNGKVAEDFKKMRYKIYALEKKIVAGL